MSKDYHVIDIDDMSTGPIIDPKIELCEDKKKGFKEVIKTLGKEIVAFCKRHPFLVTGVTTTVIIGIVVTVMALCPLTIPFILVSCGMSIGAFIEAGGLIALANFVIWSLIDFGFTEKKLLNAEKHILVLKNSEIKDGELGNLRKQSENLEQEVMDQRDLITELETTINEKEEMIDNLHNDNQKLNELVNNLEANISSSREIVDGLREQIRGLDGENGELREKMAVLNDTLEGYRIKIQDVRDELYDVRGENNSLRSTVTQLHDEIDNLNGEIIGYQKTVTDLNEKIVEQTEENNNRFSLLDQRLKNMEKKFEIDIDYYQ